MKREDVNLCNLTLRDLYDLTWPYAFEQMMPATVVIQILHLPEGTLSLHRFFYMIVMPLADEPRIFDLNRDRTYDCMLTTRLWHMQLGRRNEVNYKKLHKKERNY